MAAKCVQGFAERIGQGLTIHMLRPSEQRLINIAREVGYGIVPDIPVRNGKLVLGTKVKTKRKHRLGKADKGRNRKAVSNEFKVKQQHLDLITTIRRIRDGMVSIEVQDGLPVHLVVEEDMGA